MPLDASAFGDGKSLLIVQIEKSLHKQCFLFLFFTIDCIAIAVNVNSHLFLIFLLQVEKPLDRPLEPSEIFHKIDKIYRSYSIRAIRDRAHFIGYPIFFYFPQFSYHPNRGIIISFPEIYPHIDCLCSVFRRV